MSVKELTALYPAGFIVVSGPKARAFLDNILSNNVPALDSYKAGHSTATYTALLTPQGKILADFLVVATADGYLLELDKSLVGAIVKRLNLYKLRANVDIQDVSGAYAPALCPPDFNPAGQRVIVFSDPRSEGLGHRAVVSISNEEGLHFDEAAVQTYDSRRIEYCVPRGSIDFAYGDTYPHEANMDVLNGVSFSKGCFVGQEVVSRMQNKTVVRKRVISVSAPDRLTPGDVTAGTVVIGRVGTTADNKGLALLRLDRCIEALEAGTPLTCNGIEIQPDTAALDRFSKAMQAKVASR